MTKEALTIVANAHFKFDLKTNLRQSSDPRFQRLLSNIREGIYCFDDILALESRLDRHLSDEELTGFLDAPHIFATNKLAEKWNTIFLLHKNIPIRVAKAILIPHCETCAEQYFPCFIGEGVNVVVTRNLCTVKSVTNGSRAVIKHAYYVHDEDVLPAFVSLDIEGYTGPRLEDGTVPVPCVNEKAFCLHTNSFYDVQFLPLRTCYGLTVFKAQSRTLEKIVVNFNGFKFRDKAIYSSLSRCVKLDNVVISSSKPLVEYFFE